MQFCSGFIHHLSTLEAEFMEGSPEYDLPLWPYRINLEALPLFSLRVVFFMVFISLFLKEVELFLASLLWFLFVVSPLPSRFVVTQFM